MVLLLFLPTLVWSAGVVNLPHDGALTDKLKFDDFSERFLSPDDFVYASNKPVPRPTAADLDSIQNSQLFEGDIVGIPSDESDIINQRMRDSPMDEFDHIFNRPYHSSLNLVTYPDKLWNDGVVPYMLEEGMTADQRAAIAQAFDEYKEKTCIRFVPRSEDDFDYIYVKRNVAFGCSSYVGRAGGNQTVSLEVDKCFSKGIIAHELMHALGFFHEHSRTDRDDFVDIVEGNIRPGMMRNFEKYPKKIIDPLGLKYDYSSVMHYHKLAFSKNGKATIVPKDSNAEVGQRYRLSEIDALKINKLYQCGEFAKTTTTTTTTTTTEPTTTEEEETTADSTTTKKKQTTSTTSTTTVKPLRKKKCEDLNAHCGLWEQLGHCSHSVKYMSHYCRKSCRLCDREPGDVRGSEKKEKEVVQKAKCEDKNLFCGYWAKIGECSSDSKFMKIFCKASCKRC